MKAIWQQRYAILLYNGSVIKIRRNEEENGENIGSGISSRYYSQRNGISSVAYAVLPVFGSISVKKYQRKQRKKMTSAAAASVAA